jgi:hypothetical protein
MMMRNMACKVYAALSPADGRCRDAVRVAAADAMGCDEPWLFLEGDLLRISFEGQYFPVDEVLRAFVTALPEMAQGRLDYLDLDAWTLTRHEFSAGRFTSASRSLNQVLEYSGF